MSFTEGVKRLFMFSMVWESAIFWLTSNRCVIEYMMVGSRYVQSRNVGSEYATSLTIDQQAVDSVDAYGVWN